MAVNNEIYLNISYDKSSPVTKGQFGTIFHGKWNWTVGIGKLNNVQVAIERIEKNWFSIDIEDIRKTRYHPNILSIYATSVESDFS